MKEVCGWKPNEHEGEIWETDCGESTDIYALTPTEKGYKYCPFCGKKLYEHTPREDGDD